MSPPSRAAWIEIIPQKVYVSKIKSPPSRAAWIEIFYGGLGGMHGDGSPPSRAAWIEIPSPRIVR